MKFKTVGLQNNVVSIYDKTKTTVAGIAAQKTINSNLVIGPPLTRFIDTQNITGAINPSGPMHLTKNGRLFYMTAGTGGLCNLVLFDFDLDTGAFAYVGRITLHVPNTAATTHTNRFIRVYDGPNPASVTGWKVSFGTIGSVALNGGVFLANKVDKADFSNVSPPIWRMAQANDEKGVYMLVDPIGFGAAHLFTSVMGGGLNVQELLFSNGTAGSMTMQGMDLSIAPTVVAQTTTAATVNASPTFTLAAHGYAANQPVIITSNAPTGFTASVGTALQTVYFVRATNLTANTFELSATSGGAAINAGSVTASTVFVRAFGQTSALQIPARKTGTITTGFAGTALLNDSQQVAVIADGPLAGQSCYFFATGSNIYAFPLTNIAAGVTTLPGANGINLLGNGIDIVAPSAIFAKYMESIGKSTYVISSMSFVQKNWVNNLITSKFGGQSNEYYETHNDPTNYFRMQTIVGMETESGWVLVTSNVIGQRGIMAAHIRSDTAFDFSYAISPVIEVEEAVLRSLSTIEELFYTTEGVSLSYRTAPTAADPIFNSVAGGWIAAGVSEDLSGLSLQKFVQVKINYDVATLLTSTPAQVADIDVAYTPNLMIAENWQGSVDNTTPNGTSPARTAFRRTRVSAVAPTKYTFKAYDDTGSLVVSKNTVDHTTEFEYSTDNGTSWLPFVIGSTNVALTTEVRYNWASPPSGRITAAWSEE